MAWLQICLNIKSCKIACRISLSICPSITLRSNGQSVLVYMTILYVECIFNHVHSEYRFIGVSLSFKVNAKNRLGNTWCVYKMVAQTCCANMKKNRSFQKKNQIRRRFRFLPNAFNNSKYPIYSHVRIVKYKNHGVTGKIVVQRSKAEMVHKFMY